MGEGWGSTTNRSQGWTRHCVPELQIRVYIRGGTGRDRIIHPPLLDPKLLCLPPLSYSFCLAIISESNQKKSKQVIACLLLQIPWPLWKQAHKWLPQPPTSALTTDPLNLANLPALLPQPAAPPSPLPFQTGTKAHQGRCPGGRAHSHLSFLRGQQGPKPAMLEEAEAPAWPWSQLKT